VDYAWYFGGYLAPRILTLASLSVYTRHLSPDEFGSFALCLAWVSLASTVLLYWIQNAVQRLYPEYEATGSLGRLLGSAFALALVIMLTASPLLWLAGQDVGPMLALGTVVSFFGQGLTLMATAIATAARDRRRFAAYSMVDGTLRFGLGVAIILRGGGIAILLFIPAVSGLLLMGWEAIRLRMRGTFSIVMDLSTVSAMVKFGAPLVVVWLGSLLLANLDRFMIKWLASAHVLGIYSAAYPLGEAMVQVFATPLLVTVSTRTYARAAEVGILEARQDIVQAVRLAAAPLGLVVAVSIASSRCIVAVFLGSAFSSASNVLPWVSAGLVFWGLGSIMAKDFELTKRTHAIVPPVLIATAINAAANLVLIPRWGALGAAAATLVAYFSYFMVVGMLTGSGSLSILLRSWRPLVAAPTIGVGLRFLVDPTWPRVPALLLIACVAALAYVLFLAVLRDPELLGMARVAKGMVVRRRSQNGSDQR
jgi:O-antigen/teichoic acid export membrane protein